MKFYTTIPAGLKPYFEKEVQSYRSAFAKGDLPKVWYHLERAHIVGQAYPWQHSLVHWEMLKFSFRIKSAREFL